MSTTETAQNETNGTVVSFDDMFKELSLLEDGQEAPKKPEEAPAEPVKATEEAPKAEEAPAPAEEAPAEPVKAAEPPADNTDEVLQRLARLVKEEPAPREEAPVAPTPEAPIYTKDEQDFLSTYEKDWPDVARAESLRRRAEYKELINYVFSEVSKELRPVVETVQAMGNRTHLTDLKSTVTDYEDVRDKVVDWVGTQPTYLQIAYKHVIQSGTVDEVADLVNRYKRETGVTAAPAVAAPAARKAETELPSATKKAAAELAPVSSKRAAVVTNAEPETFDDAFAMFAKS